MIINPYLNFEGTTEEAFNFYKSVFGGEFSALVRFKDTGEAGRVPAEHLNKIMHIALPVGNNILMATDAIPEMGHHLNLGNNIQLSINENNKDEAYRIFKALSDGGKVIVEFKKEFWGEYFALFTDKFGIQWMINYREAQ